MLTNAGLGAKQEHLFIQTADENGRSLGGASRIIPKQTDEAGKAEIVQIVTIDNMIGLDRKVSIIQLDVEGYEKEALTGGIKTIQRCLPIIILEFSLDNTLINSDWFLENILSLGYRKVNEIDCNFVFSR